MNFPIDTVRTALYTLLNGNVSGYTVLSAPATTDGNFVLIGDIRARDTSYQSNPIFDLYIPIEVVSKQALTHTGKFSKKAGSTASATIEGLCKPSLVTFGAVSGWTVTDFRLDDHSEDVTLNADVSIFRIVDVYYLRIVKP